MTAEANAANQADLKPAFGYVRVSTKRQADGELSLPDQEDAIRRYALQKGFRIVAMFSDAETGTRESRDGLNSMTDRVFNDPVQPCAIFIHSLSRIFRDQVEFALLRKRLRKIDVEIISVTQDFGSTDVGDLLTNIVALFDQHQSQENGKHVVRAMILNAKQGFWNGSTPPYGYRTEIVEHRGARAKKVLVIDPVEAEIVRQIYALRLAGDGNGRTMGTKAIVNHLNSAGIRTRNGKRWGTGAIDVILKRTTYVGVHVYNKTNSRKGTKRPESEHIIVQVPAIISEKTFLAVNKLMKAANPKIGRPRAVTGPTLLTELAKCSKCGSAMTMATGTSRTGEIHRYYKCASRIRVGVSMCEGVSVPMEKLDDTVMYVFQEIVLDPHRIVELFDGLREKHTLESDAIRRRVADLNTVFNDADRKLKNLYKGIADGVLSTDDPTLKAMVDGAKADRDVAHEALERLTTIERNAANISDAQIHEFTNEIREALKDSDVHFRKAWIRALFRSITVEKDKVVVEGSAEALETAVVEQTKNGAAVRAYEPKWRAGEDETGNSYVIAFSL